MSTYRERRAHRITNCWYERYFLKPHTSGSAGVAYVPVAKGIQSVWTEGYQRQRSDVTVALLNPWIHMRSEVGGRKARIIVDGAEATRKPLNYKVGDRACSSAP